MRKPKLPGVSAMTKTPKTPKEAKPKKAVKISLDDLNNDPGILWLLSRVEEQAEQTPAPHEPTPPPIP